MGGLAALIAPGCGRCHEPQTVSKLNIIRSFKWIIQRDGQRGRPCLRLALPSRREGRGDG